MIVIPRTRLAQPTGRLLTVDPRAQLYSAVVGGQEIVRGDPIARVNGGLVGPYPKGQGLQFSEASQQYATGVKSGASWAKYSFVAQVYGTGTDAGQSNVFVANNATYGAVQLRHTTSAWDVYHYDVSASWKNIHVSGAYSNEKVQTLVVVFDGALITLYIDGDVAGTVAAAGYGVSAPTGITLGCDWYNGPQPNSYWQGVIGLFCVANGVAWDADYAARVSADPWNALFLPEPTRIFALPSGGGTEQALSAAGTSSADGSASLAATVALAGVGVALGSGAAGLAADAPVTAGGAATASGSAIASTEIALSAMGIAVSAGTAELSAASAGALQAAGGASAAGTATATADITITAAGLAHAAGAAGMSASQLLAGAGAAQSAGNAALAAEIRAIAAGVAQATGSADLAGGVAGAVDAVGQVTASGSAALILTVRLTATGTAHGAGEAALEAGTGVDMTAAGAASGAGAADIAAEVQITAAGFAQAMGAGFIVLQVPIVATGAGLASGAAVLTSGAALVLIANPLFTVHSSGQHYQVEAPARRYQVGRS